MVLVHSVVRWLVLLAAVGALVGYGRALGRSRFDTLAERLGSVYAAAIGVQLLIGVVLWLIQARWVLDDAFLAVIHPLLMLLATGIASAGVARARRTRSAVTGLIGVALSLLLVVLAIPSSAWPW